MVTADDGTWGFGLTLHSGVTVPLINDHLGPLIEGANCMATERLWDLMQKAVSPYGAGGVTSFAISAVDNALWDLKGKLLGVPVYELIGGPQKEKIFCYASNTDISYRTENSIEWFLELGFKAVKLFLREGPDAGLAGINRSEELVAGTREQVGDDIEIAVDGWMSLNTEPRPRGYLPARSPVGGWNDRRYQDLPSGGGIRTHRDPACQHELPVRPAPRLRDAGRNVGRTV